MESTFDMENNYELQKEKLEGILSLSCIESHFLYLLREKTEKWELAYFDSFAGFVETVERFLSGRIDYTHFDIVKRVQKSAAEIGILRTEHISELSAHGLKEHGTASIMVSTEFMENRYGKRAWRDDHYILLRPSPQGGFYYLNDVPRDSGRMTDEDVDRLGVTDAFSIRIVGDITPLSEALFGIFRRRLNEGNERFPDGKVITADVLRDIIGVLRIIRRRAERFLACYGICLKDAGVYFEYLDRSYALLEYMRLRKRELKYEDGQEMLRTIGSMDAALVKEMKSGVNGR